MSDKVYGGLDPQCILKVLKHFQFIKTLTEKDVISNNPDIQSRTCKLFPCNKCKSWKSGLL